MYWILDLAVAVLLLLIVVLAVKRGFIRSVYRFAALIAAVFIAMTFSSPAAGFLEKKYIRSAVYDAVDGVVAPVAEKLESFSPKALVADLPEGFRTAAKLLGADMDAAAETVSPADERMPVSEQLTAAVTDPIAHTVSGALGFAVVFLASYAVLLLLGLLLNKIAELPILRFFNRVLGFLFGFCEAAAAGILLSKLLLSVCGAYALSHPDFPFSDLAGNTVVISFLAGLFS